MAFQVANGSIPETVERFLRERVGAEVRQWHGHWRGLWLLELDATDGRVCGGAGTWEFGWPHDREPTLQEAMEAVMAEHMGFERAAR